MLPYAIDRLTVDLNSQQIPQPPSNVPPQLQSLWGQAANALKAVLGGEAQKNALRTFLANQQGVNGYVNQDFVNLINGALSLISADIQGGCTLAMALNDGAARMCAYQAAMNTQNPTYGNSLAQYVHQNEHSSLQGTIAEYTSILQGTRPAANIPQQQQIMPGYVNNMQQPNMMPIQYAANNPQQSVMSGNTNPGQVNYNPRSSNPHDSSWVPKKPTVQPVNTAQPRDDNNQHLFVPLPVDNVEVHPETEPVGEEVMSKDNYPLLASLKEGQYLTSSIVNAVGVEVEFNMILTPLSGLTWDSSLLQPTRMLYHPTTHASYLAELEGDIIEYIAKKENDVDYNDHITDAEKLAEQAAVKQATQFMVAEKPTYPVRDHVDVLAAATRHDVVETPYAVNNIASDFGNVVRVSSFNQGKALVKGALDKLSKKPCISLSTFDVVTEIYGENNYTTSQALSDLIRPPEVSNAVYVNNITDILTKEIKNKSPLAMFLGERGISVTNELLNNSLGIYQVIDDVHDITNLGLFIAAEYEVEHCEGWANRQAFSAYTTALTNILDVDQTIAYRLSSVDTDVHCMDNVYYAIERFALLDLPVTFAELDISLLPGEYRVASEINAPTLFSNIQRATVACNKGKVNTMIINLKDGVQLKVLPAPMYDAVGFTVILM